MRILYIYNRMFRLSISGPVAENCMKRNGAPVRSEWVRIYRWGDMWGMMGAEWVVESRHQLAHTIDAANMVLLEEIREENAIQSPPYDIDDVWDQEIIKDGSIEYGNMVCIQGNLSELQTQCVFLKIPFSQWLQDTIQRLNLSNRVETKRTIQATTQSLPQRTLQSKTNMPRPIGIRQGTSQKRRPVCLIES